MIKFSKKDEKLIFHVQVVARAALSEVVGEHNGALRVRVAAAPVDGAANRELIRTLAAAFGIPISRIEITRGHSGKLKTVSIGGLSTAVLTRFNK
jgi:uncharacterized protein